MKFNECLRKLRRARGISQQALADSIYVSRSAVAKWESGRGVPNQSSYDMLLSYFSVTADELPLEVCVTERDVKKSMARKMLLVALCVFVAIVLLLSALFTYSLMNGFGFTPESAVGEYWAKSEFIETDSYIFYYECMINEDGESVIIEKVRTVEKLLLGYRDISDEVQDYEQEVYNSDGERVGRIFSFQDGDFCHNFFITDLRAHPGSGLLATVIPEIVIKEEAIPTFLGSYFITSWKISEFSSHGVEYKVK